MVMRKLLKTHCYAYHRIGNRLGVGDGTAGLRMGKANGLNQLTEHGGGPIRFAGSIDEPGKVWVAGYEARMRHMTDFEAWLELSPGTHQGNVQKVS